ncbi:hypothetical protein Tco_1032960 [Tanacetum coccineum]|uniref:Uncharacterized protein n=1 Tax=Tanacetum coccineum TaxID=301880 RepID=A0ABQ5GDJ5_9ASTR
MVAQICLSGIAEKQYVMVDLRQEEAGSVVAGQPLVIISHRMMIMTDEASEGGVSASDIFSVLQRYRMFKVLLNQSFLTSSDTTCRIDHHHEYLGCLGWPEDHTWRPLFRQSHLQHYVHGPEGARQAPPSPSFCSRQSDPEAAPGCEDDDCGPEEDPVLIILLMGMLTKTIEDEPSKGGYRMMMLTWRLIGMRRRRSTQPPCRLSIVVALPTMDQAHLGRDRGVRDDEFVAKTTTTLCICVTDRISFLLLIPTPVWSGCRVIGRKPEVTLPPRKRLGIALGPRYEVGESSSAAAARPTGGLRADYGFVATMDREIRRDPERDVGYGITDSWDEIVETLQGAPVSTDTELGQHMTAFKTRIETEARLSREAWRRSMDASDLARGEVMSLRTTVLGQMSEIRELHAADRKRQVVTSEMLKADHKRSAKMRELRTADRTRQQQLIQTLTVMQSLQGHVTTLQGQVTELQGQVTPGTRWRSCTARAARGGW